MKRSSGIISVLACLALATCSGSMVVTNQPETVDHAHHVDDIRWGVNGHPFTAYDGVSLDEQIDAVARLGFKEYRVNLKGEVSLDYFDRLLAAAQKRGVTVLPILVPDISFDKESPAEIYAKAYKHAERMGKRYAGRVKVWELGNEYENFAIIQPCEKRDNGEPYLCSWGPGPGATVLDYYGPRWAKVSAALKGLSEGMHAGDPHALRAVGTAGWGHIAAFERMKNDGVQWDISVWHVYGLGSRWAMEKLQQYGKPIWITEFNAPQGSTDGDKKQADGLAAMMAELRSFKQYGVVAAHVYELLDEPYWEGYEGKMGLIRLNKTSDGWDIGADKPAAAIVKTTIAAK